MGMWSLHPQSIVAVDTRKWHLITVNFQISLKIACWLFSQFFFFFKHGGMMQLL
jgi:hypothetical protein